MDNIVFYQPPSASSSQPPRLPGTLTSSNTSRVSIASLSVRQTALQLNQRNKISKDHITKSRDISDLPQQRYPLDQRCRYDLVQEQENLSITRNSADSNDDNLPDVDELLSGIEQKNKSASADLNSDDDDGFVDIDKLLSSIKRKSISANAKLNSGGIAEKVDNETRGGSPADSIRSTEGSSQDPIILSDDESVSAESETDYSNLDIDLTAKTDSYSPHIADIDLANGDGFRPKTTLVPDRLLADHQDDGNDNGVVDGAKLRLAVDRLRSASPSHGSVIRQASPLRANTKITQRSASYVDLDVTEEVKDKGIDVFAKGDNDDDADARSTKRSRSSAIYNNPASDSNVSVSDLQDGQHDSAQSPQPGPAVVSLQQSDLTNDPLPRHRRRRDATRHIHRKRLRTPAPTRLASTVSVALESNDLEGPQSVALLAAPGQEREISDIDQEIVDDGGTDDSNDEDYGDMSDATASEIRYRPHSRKRVRRTRDTEHNDMAAPPTLSLNVSYQTTAATSSGNIQESEEIPIHRYLTLKTIESKVVYYLTFSQELLLKPSRTSQRQGITRNVSSNSDRGDLERLPVHKRAMNRRVRNSRFSSKDDELLLQLKRKGLSWDKISDRFPERSKGTLQVHYSTKLKRRSDV